MCLNNSYMILGLGDQYLGNYHNNKTLIYSVEIYVVMVDRHTLLP